MYSIVKYQPSEYGSYRFPAWAELLGILMGLLSCLMIPAGMLVAVLREEGSLWEVSLPHPCLPPAPNPPQLALGHCSSPPLASFLLRGHCACLPPSGLPESHNQGPPSPPPTH